MVNNFLILWLLTKWVISKWNDIIVEISLQGKDNKIVFQNKILRRMEEILILLSKKSYTFNSTWYKEMYYQVSWPLPQLINVEAKFLKWLDNASTWIR